MPRHNEVTLLFLLGITAFFCLGYVIGVTITHGLAAVALAVVGIACIDMFFRIGVGR